MSSITNLPSIDSLNLDLRAKRNLEVLLTREKGQWLEADGSGVLRRCSSKLGFRFVNIITFGGKVRALRRTIQATFNRIQETCTSVKRENSTHEKGILEGTIPLRMRNFEFHTSISAILTDLLASVNRLSLSNFANKFLATRTGELNKNNLEFLLQNRNDNIRLEELRADREEDEALRKQSGGPVVFSDESFDSILKRAEKTLQG